MNQVISTKENRIFKKCTFRPVLIDKCTALSNRRLRCTFFVAFIRILKCVLFLTGPFVLLTNFSKVFVTSQKSFVH